MRGPGVLTRIPPSLQEKRFQLLLQARVQVCVDPAPLFTTGKRQVNSPGVVIPPSRNNAVPVQSMKRQLNAISEGNPLPVKRVRLTQADAQTGQRSVLSEMG